MRSHTIPPDRLDGLPDVQVCGGGSISLPAVSALRGSLCFALLAVLAVGAVSAQTRKQPPRLAQKTLESWDAELTLIDRQLIEGNPKRAYRLATNLSREMVELVVSAPQVPRLLGVASVLRALAAHQLGDADEALWHWHVAHQVFPETHKLLLTVYGAAGEFLQANPPRNRGGKVGDTLLAVEGVTPPRKRRAPAPRFPLAKREAQPVSVTVQVIVGVDGRPRSPLLRDSEGELTLVWATLEALRRWEFDPAERDGVEVAVFYDLAVNFGRRR